MDLDWPRVLITLLTLAAFGLSATGLLLIRRDARNGVLRMTSEREKRNRLLADLRSDTAAASTDEERAAATGRWRQRHADAGLEPHSYKTLNEGRELLAERIIHELDQGSRVDVILVGLGLLCGLAASIWGTWLPNA